jgi:uncharacterized LabA/DUF88 family protein
MISRRKNVAYIDNSNLYINTKKFGLEIDYRKFRVYLSEKLLVDKAYIFTGYVESNENLYQFLKSCGYILIFKTVITELGKIKGNCDAELVLKSVIDHYESDHHKVVIVTSDGDFSCLVDFLKSEGRFERLISPSPSNKCSVLLKRCNVKITFICDIQNLISRS